MQTELDDLKVNHMRPDLERINSGVSKMKGRAVMNPIIIDFVSTLLWCEILETRLGRLKSELNISKE